MYTDVQIINLGLAHIAASRVTQIAPPRSGLEVFVAEGYTAWKRSELTKRRWVFALEEDYQLTLSATLGYGDRPYKYALPTDCLRPVRQRRTEWQQRGRFVLSSDSALRIQYIKNVPESDWDALFVDVMSWRIALECCEYTTQSNSKKEFCARGYEDARKTAGQANAFIIGPEDVYEDDNDYPFVYSRYI